VPDFSLDSVEHKIEAQGFVVTTQDPLLNLINVKLTGHQIPETLSAIDRLWMATGSKTPISRVFLEERIQTLYLAMLREAQLIGVFAMVAVMLACLGLLGLAASMAERRTREIGIRKALGARRQDILLQFLIESALMALIGGAIGVLGGVTVAELVTLASGFPSTVAVWSVLAGLVMATGTGLFFGVYPARKAADLDPIVALRAD